VPLFPSPPVIQMSAFITSTSYSKCLLHHLHQLAFKCLLHHLHPVIQMSPSPPPPVIQMFPITSTSYSNVPSITPPPVIQMSPSPPPPPFKCLLHHLHQLFKCSFTSTSYSNVSFTTPSTSYSNVSFTTSSNYSNASSLTSTSYSNSPSNSPLVIQCSFTHFHFL
jgi:hypothetical protein